MQVYRTPLLTLDPDAKAGGGLVEVVKLADAQAMAESLQGQLVADQKVKADYDRWLSGGVYFTTADYEKYVAEHRQQVEALQAQLKQVEGERAKWEDIAGLRFAGDHKFVKEMELLKVENTTLRQLVEAHAKQLTELTIIPIGCSREQELRWTQSIKDLRATLAAQG